MRQIRFQREKLVYILIDPRSGKCRYVGRSKNPASRLEAHMYGSRLSSFGMKRWMRTLDKRGLLPRMKIVRNISEHAAIIKFKPDLNTARGDGWELCKQRLPRLKRIREWRGISREELADMVLLTKTGIAKAERGRMVNLRTAERLAGALGVKLEALVKS